MATKVFFEDINMGAGYGFDRTASRNVPNLLKRQQGQIAGRGKGADTKAVDAPFKGA
ncbi:MAG: hypothetical protein ING19_08750 [Azospirillum sp.]|nr:hypothetical protein [Azospirillum sp.]